MKYHKSSLGEGISSFTKLSSLELKLYQNLQECQKTVHNALADSFDTPTAMRALKSIVSGQVCLTTDNLSPINELGNAALKTKRCYKFNIRDSGLVFLGFLRFLKVPLKFISC